MKPRPKSAKQILIDKWPNKQPNQVVSEYTSQIQHELSLNLPKELQSIVKLKHFDQGMLTLTIPNGLYQIKFNAIRSDLLSSMRQKFPNLISIKCVVDPNQAISPINNALASQISKPTKQLTSEAKKQILAVLDDMPEEVKNALTKLIS